LGRWRYTDAIDGFLSLLSGPDSAAFLERIRADFRREMANHPRGRECAAPRWSADGKWIAWETGTGANRVTRIVSTANDHAQPVDVKGGALVFAPNDARAAYVTGTAMDGALVERDLVSGTERTVIGAGLLKAQVAYDADGRTLYVVAGEAGATRALLYPRHARRRTDDVVPRDSTIADLQIVSGGRQLVFGIGGRNPVATGGGPGGGRGGGAGARTRFGVFEVPSGNLRELTAKP
jgi:hypothetical protein